MSVCWLDGRSVIIFDKKKGSYTSITAIEVPVFLDLPPHHHHPLSSILYCVFLSVLVDRTINLASMVDQTNTENIKEFAQSSDCQQKGQAEEMVFHLQGGRSQSFHQFEEF